MRRHLRGHMRVFYKAATVPAIGYPLLLCWQRGWLPRPRGEVRARLHDGRMLRCQLSDRTQRTMYFDLFEPAETRLITTLLGPGDSFIDVGAHIGWFITLQRAGSAEAGRCLPASHTLPMRPR